jgi:glycosyltransferase involved in cell wall biosynthesis
LDSSLSNLQVLFIYLSEAFDEDEQLALEDILELNANGLQWKIICIKNSALYQHLIPFGKDRLITLEHSPRELFDRQLRDLLRQEIANGCNLVHSFGSNYLGSILPWMLGFPRVPVVVTEGTQVQKNMRHFLQSLFYVRMDALLVPSAALRKRIQKMRPVLANKTRVVHPGLDFNIFNPDHFDFTVLRKKWGIESDFYLVGMIASQEYIKAQSAFIKAAASFLRNEELAKRTKFVIVGFDHEGNEELIDLIRQFHLQDQIILAPFEESIPKVLGTLDVYVLPSSKAMFGLQAIESLAMGTPIICASGLDSTEWIGNSQGGLLMRSGDSFDLQRKLRTILEDPEEFKAMGTRAVQFARKNYDRNKRTDKIMDVYQRVVRRRKSA